MISKPQRSLGTDTPRPIVDLYKTTDELVDCANTYLPPVTTFQMGYVNTTVATANTYTPFLITAGISAVYADSTATSVIEAQIMYFSGVTDFVIRMRENLSSNPRVLFQQTVAGALPVVTSRLNVVATFPVGRCLTNPNTPYILEVASPTTSATLALTATLKIVRGVR